MKRAVSGAFVYLLAVLSAVFVVSGHVQAQDGQTISWTKLPGTAVDVSINAAGQAYVTAVDGTPWRWDKVEQRWRRMSGKFVRITAAEGNRPWAIDAGGVVYRYNGLWWENKDSSVSDVAADIQGNVYIAKTDGSIRKWNPLRSEWQPKDGPKGGNARRIALDSAGNPWVVTRASAIRAFDGKAWNAFPGRAVDIAVGATDTVVIADGEGAVRKLNAAGRGWNVVAGISNAVAVAVTPDGGQWVVSRDGSIMASALLISEEVKAEEDRAPDAKAPPVEAPVSMAPVETAPPAVAPSAVAPALTASTATAQAQAPEATGPGRQGSTDPAAVTFKGKITFINTRKSATTIAIGKDGSVFGLGVGGNVLRWSNTRKTFESFPGTLVRIAVDPEGNPWGISALGRVFRHTGKLWKQITGATGSDIAIGADGAVLIADATGALYKLNDAGTRFDRIAGSGLLVAVGPDGTPWTVRSDQLVQRCDTSPCTVLPQKAMGISVGPDGSVWIVSDRNLLMRLKADGKSFEVVQTAGHTPAKVAVGPNGYPWVVSSTKLALASSYFERDEATDRAVAASTAGGTSGSGAIAAVVEPPTATSFTFSKNMSFDTYASGLVNFSGLATGENGKVYVWGDAGGQVVTKIYKVFNSTKKTFETVSLSFPQDVNKIDVAEDGAIWGFVSGNVYKLSATGSLLRTYTVPLGTAKDMAIGADGTVYIVVGSLLYRLKPGSGVFSKFSNDDVTKVAVGRAGELWITDSSLYIQQYTGARFENRPLGQSIEGTDIGASSNGSVYISVWSGSAPLLKKWNATNKSFDTVNNAHADILDVDPDGRPWIVYTSTNNDVKRGKD